LGLASTASSSSSFESLFFLLALFLLFGGAFLASFSPDAFSSLESSSFLLVFLLARDGLDFVFFATFPDSSLFT